MWPKAQVAKAQGGYRNTSSTQAPNQDPANPTQSHTCQTPVKHKNPTTTLPVFLQAPFEYILLSKPLFSSFIFDDDIILHKRGLIAPGQGGLRTPPCTPLYFGVRGGYRLLIQGCTPRTPARLGYARLKKACIRPTSVHASSEGRAQLARPSEGACTLCMPFQRGMHAVHAPPERRAPASHASLRGMLAWLT